MKHFIFAAVLLCAASAIGAAPVKTLDGLVEGTVEDGIDVYRGIPFAAPPVGNLRWRAPQPVKKWPAVRAANEFAASCMQPTRASTLTASALTVSEDCLYLNVWSPAKSADAKLPVMVWIYGGGFMAGSTAIPLYSGEQLAKKGVVVVSVAYRVGPMGFFAHPALSAESEHHVSGNYGLLDQIAGLRWVQQNIAAFGGDPRRVTIFGESAGAISVSMLAVSPLAKGLFSGAISESGGSFGPPRSPGEPGENVQPLAAAEQDGVAYATKMEARSASDLRKLSAEAVASGAGAALGLSWPVLDGWVIPDDQYKRYAAGQYNDTPILIGTNSDEGALFPMPPTRDAYVEGVRRRYGPFADAILKHYPPAEQGWLQSSRDLMRDVGFGWHTWVWARLQSKAGKSKVFYYYFDHAPPRTEDSRFKHAAGAVHAEEMVYVFQHLDQQPLPWTAEDRAISEAMATYWTNFAKHGDPNGEGVPQWPAYSEASGAVMHFNAKPEVGKVANLAKIEALDKYFRWRRTDEGAKLGMK